MKEKRVCGVSLIVIGLSSIGLGLCRLLWAGVPDVVVRTLGIIILIALPVLTFAAVRLAGSKKK